ncbi:MAG: hypothetical protein KDD82_21380 [Planctomycetes bacterium]|nr:hypothetical protein [Planctomycetota bacterium]
MSEPEPEPGVPDPANPQRESAAGDAPTRPPEGPRPEDEDAPAEASDPSGEDLQLALPPPLIGRDPSVHAAPVQPAAPAPKAARAPSWITLGVATLALGVLLVLTAPWLASASLLSETARRSLQTVGGERAGVVHASLGWNDGLSLDRVYLPDAQETLPAIVLRELRLETNLLQGVSGYLWGDTVVAKLVAREGRIAFGTHEAAAVSSASAGAPSSAAPAAEPFHLPFPLRPSIDFANLDLEIHWQPGEVEPRRALFRGLSATGGGLIGKDLALQLDDGLAFHVDTLSVERVEEAGPALVFGLEDADFSTERLIVPAPEAFSAQAVNTRMAIKAPRARFGDLRLSDVSAELAFRDGVCDLSCAGREARGGLKFTSHHVMRDPERWPSTLQLELDQLKLTPDLRAQMPILIPLLAATSSAGGAGLPAVSLKLDVAFDVVYTPEGAFDQEATTRTAQGSGSFALSPGLLSTSLLIDGYVRALLNVSVSTITERLVPPVLEVEGVEGSFTIEDGVVTLPRIVLRAKQLGLLLAGTVRFDGTYELLVTTLLPEGELNPAQALAKAVDAAGGVTLFGNLAEGSVDYRLPPADALLAAVQAQGVLETLATASGELGAELRDLLKKSKSK